MKWFNPQNEPFKIYGFAFYESEHLYRRMPLSPKYTLPAAVDGLADETAGGQIRFHAKMKELTLRISLASKPGFFDSIRAPHSAETLKNGFDLYLSKNGKDFIFYDVAKNLSDNDKFYERRLVSFNSAEEFDILLNFPAYGGVDKVLIGLDDDAEISKPVYRFKDDKKIVIYGSSIQQGASALRPGNTCSAILSRMTDREVYNLGFNSSGKGEPEVAETISDIENTAALIISIEGNCPDSEWLDEKLRKFVEIYRKKNPTTPIVIMPFIISGKDYLTPELYRRRMIDREIQRSIVEDRKNGGDENIYLFLQDKGLTAETDSLGIWHEITVDGLHYNDMGFYITAKALYEFLEKVVHI